MVRKIKHVVTFLRSNKNRWLSIKALFLSAFFRICILCVPMKRLKKYMGTPNKESALEESTEIYRKVYKVAHSVNRVCDQTPWESKCLVRALTAQYLLKKQKIPTTLYLGVGKDDEKMTAHAWIRTGTYYVTGGNGEGYAMVAKFRK